MLATVGSICTILLILVLVGLQSWFYSERDELANEKLAASENRDLKALHLEQEETLNSYRAISTEDNQYAIPIDVAMQRVVEQHREARNDNTE